MRAQSTSSGATASHIGEGRSSSPPTPDGKRRQRSIVRRDKADVLAAMETLEQRELLRQRPTPPRKRPKDAREACTASLQVAADPHGHFVYCPWGDDPDRPLYVGQSSNLYSRLGTHLSNSTRRWSIKRVSTIRCESRADAFNLEGQLILIHRPEWNIRGLVTR